MRMGRAGLLMAQLRQGGVRPATVQAQAVALALPVADEVDFHNALLPIVEVYKIMGNDIFCIVSMPK